ncbi:MAG: hydroxymethylbilane synthase [Pseudomonadota bacterium]
MGRKPLIGTRGSALALWQAGRVASLLSCEVEIKTIKTSGDIIKGELGPGGSDIGFFTSEIEKKLSAGQIDIAVHSLKDLPTVIPDDLVVAAFVERDFTADLLITLPGKLESEDPLVPAAGMKIGTSSLRRRALCAEHMPSAAVVPMRGNVDTRVKKLREGACDAIIIARAGFERLSTDRAGLAVFELNPRLWLPSPGQGVIAAEVRAQDSEMVEMCAAISHGQTRTAVAVERALMKLAEGGCHAPFGALAGPSAKIGEPDLWEIVAGMLDEGGAWKSIKIQGSPATLAVLAIRLLKDGNIPKLVPEDNDRLGQRL